MAVDKYKLTPEEMEFGTWEPEAAQTATPEVPWYQSYPSAAARGVVEAVLSVGRMMGPTIEKSADTQAAQINRQLLEEEYLPIGNDLGPRAVERGTKSAVEALAFPIKGANALAKGVNIATRAGIGGGLAEGAKEIGAPNWLQTAIELGAQVAPGLGKNIPITELSEQQLKSFAERNGMTPEEYTLAIQGEGSLRNWVMRIASKGGRTQRAVDRTRTALSDLWDSMRSRPDAQTPLSGVQSNQFITRMSNKLSRLSSEQRNRIMTDYNDLLGSQMTGSDIMDFWKKMNYYIAHGERELGTLKEDMQWAFGQLSPSLGNDFSLANRMYTNFARARERLTPDMVDTFFTTGEVGSLIGGLTTGNLSLIQSALGAAGGRLVGAELVSNPRFQKLVNRFASALGQNLYPAAKKFYDEMVIEVGKNNAEAAQKMSEFDLDKYEQALRQISKKNKD